MNWMALGLTLVAVVGALVLRFVIDVVRALVTHADEKAAQEKAIAELRAREGR
jgi:hypothetical protein